MERFTVRVDGAGRIRLPAEVRRQLKLQQGSELVAHVDNQQLVLRTRLQALRAAQAYFSRFRKKGELLSEELIRERREEAHRDLDD
ncbi:MAG: AbrB/MazE/SpoVT family DNA-binding domain-containing protein [Bryobacteraceae bacterium]